jgi:AcrR family transcriptional regulator
MDQTRNKTRKIRNKGWLRRHANVDTKQDIVRASGALFARHGYAGTSVVDIANSVGIKDASIYNHFKSKQEILYAFLVQIHEGLLEECSNALEKAHGQPAKQQLLVFVEALVSYLVDNIEVTPMVDAFTYRSVKVLSEEQTASLSQYERQVFELLRSVLTEGVEQGDFSVDDITITAFAILGGIEHLVYWYRPGGRLSKVAIQKQLADFATIAVRASQ